MGDLVSNLIHGARLIDEGTEALGLEDHAPASLIEDSADALWSWGSSLFY